MAASYAPIFIVPVGMLLLLPFDPPGILRTGEIQAETTAALLTGGVLTTLPILFLRVLGEDIADWKSVRGALRRLMRVCVLAISAFCFGLLSMALLLWFAIPFMTNALLQPPVQSWVIPVVSVKVQPPAPKRCARTISFEYPTLSGHILDLCADRDEVLEMADKGDRLILIGRNGPFGITYSSIRIFPTTVD